MSKIELGTKGLLIFLAFVFLFPIFYLFVPIYLGFAINTIIIISASYIAWQNDEKRLVIVALLYFVLNSFFLIRYISTLELLSQTLTLDPVEYMRIASLGLVIAKFIQYLPLILIFFGAFAFLYVWVFFTTRGASTYRFAIVIGYIGVISTIVLIFIDMFFWTGGNPIVEGFEFVLFGNPFLMPFEIYYFVQISIWFMASFTFVITFLSHISGGED